MYAPPKPAYPVLAPADLAQFDAFPKLPATYKARSESRGFLTLFVAFAAFLLVLNDLGEFIWGWPDYEFGVDIDKANTMDINVDMVVNMPCQCKQIFALLSLFSRPKGITLAIASAHSVIINSVAGQPWSVCDMKVMGLKPLLPIRILIHQFLDLSVDLRDAVGDRLMLSDGFRRDGTLFDIGQATALKEHAAALSARQAVAQSRKSRGLFATLFSRTSSGYGPTYNYKPSGSACRVYGTVQVKKVTGTLHHSWSLRHSLVTAICIANLHITTAGHGYASRTHVDHKSTCFRILQYPRACIDTCSRQ